MRAQVKPFTDRIARSMAELRALGLDDQRIARLAELTNEQLNSPDKPDAATIEVKLVNELQGLVGPQAVSDAGTRLTNAGGGPDALVDVDLGTVPEDVAKAAGYDCLTTIDISGS